MVQLIDQDVRTREVLGWQGLHLLHARMASCSQKTRIFLRVKGIPWESHEIELGKNDNYSEWFLGINPRGLVPVLVWDGAVHIESNDIITLLDEHFPEPRLIPPERAAEIAALLKREDDLHLDLRVLSFRFVHGRTGTTKSPEAMARYRTAGSGTVGGKADEEGRGKQLRFYQRLADEGLSDAMARASAERFRSEFDTWEQRLEEGAYLLGDALTVVDIAWFVYANRLELGGFPLDQLYPAVSAWLDRLRELPEFAEEVRPPAAVAEHISSVRRDQEQSGTTLAQVVGL